METTIITAAITGSIHTPSMSPYLPITPKEIADEAVRSYKAGAAVAHIHVRDPKNGKPSVSADLFEEVISDIKRRCNIILCLSTGAGLGMTVDERSLSVRKFRPELGSLNFGSINFALFPQLKKNSEWKFDWESEYIQMTENFIFPNTFKTLKEFCTIFNKSNTKPEIEIYDVGMINNVKFMINEGYLKMPVYLQFVLGILGGIQPSIQNVMFLYQTAKSVIGEFEWSVCAAGRHQINMCTLSLLMGGNVRVGLEDSLYIEKGIKAKTNADQVNKIVRIAKEIGIEPATPDEARNILKLKGMGKVNF